MLSALGRPQDEETRQNLVNKYGGKAGKVDWASSEFLRDISSYPLTDISLVEEFVYSAAFSTFDQVSTEQFCQFFNGSSFIIRMLTDTFAQKICEVLFDCLLLTKCTKMMNT